MKNTIQARPAETSTAIAGAIVALLAKPLHLDSAQEVAEATVLVAAVPAIVTFIVEKVRTARS